METTGLLDMAISFSKLKNPALAPTDQLMFGKFKGCRVCDIVEDQFPYLMWLDANKMVSFTTESKKLMATTADLAKAKRHYEEEEKPYEDGYSESPGVHEINFDDVPF